MKTGVRLTIRLVFPSGTLTNVGPNPIFERHFIPLRELPPITAIHALAKCRHRLIGTARLGLRVANHALPALSALELLGDGLLHLGDHGVVHVLFLELLVSGLALVRLHFLGRHGGEALGGDLTRLNHLAEVNRRFVLKVGEERADLGLVGFVHAGAGIVVDGFFDGAGGLEDVGGSWQGSI